MTKKIKDNDILTDIATELFKLMAVDADFEVETDAENNAMILKVQAGDETGLLIGNRGRTLNSLQTIIGIMFKQRTGEWKRIIMDVGGWRDKEKERLNEIANTTAERAKQTGESQSLYNLTPSQRRVVHMILSEDKGVVTESFGEGNDRYMVVSPKK